MTISKLDFLTYAILVCEAAWLRCSLFGESENTRTGTFLSILSLIALGIGLPPGNWST